MAPPVNAGFFSTYAGVTLTLAIFAIAVGLLVLVANPRRFSNQAFLMLSLLVAAWLGCVCAIGLMRIRLSAGSDASDRALLLVWRQMNTAVASFFPWATWLLKESVLRPDVARWRTLVRSLPWFGFGCLELGLVLMPSFAIVAADGTIRRGALYVVYSAAAIVACLFLAWQAAREMRHAAGIRRVEMQFMSLTTLVACSLVFLLNLGGNLFHLPWLHRGALVVVLASLFLAAWAMTYHRVFDARQVFLSLAQRAAVLLLVAGGTVGAWIAIQPREGDAFVVFVAAALFGGLGLWLHDSSRHLIDREGERRLARAREAVLELAKRETDPRRLVPAFEEILRGHFGAESAVLLFDLPAGHGAGDVLFAKDRSGHAALCARGWMTPERLERGKAADALLDLQQFISEHRLGLILTVRRDSPMPPLLVALGTKTDGWVFTYPEIQRVQNVAELMDSILMQLRLASQAALRTRMEHLAMMSRGLAHDLKNLITPVSSFLVHAEKNLPPDSVEAEVHAAAKRSVRVMTEYVRESLSFAERLEPRVETMELGPVLEGVREVTKARAARRGVQVNVVIAMRLTLVADAVLLQRMLANLVSNAIDASAAAGAVTLVATEPAGGQVRIRVIDHGTGIAPEHLGRIFEPYFTTKEFGDDVRGFGLGLAIAQKIVRLHQGTLSIESKLGQGTCVTVDLPAAQPATRGRSTAWADRTG
jgi:signal transduction histidine kinase